MLVSCHFTTQCNNPEDYELYFYHCENLKSCARMNMLCIMSMHHLIDARKCFLKIMIFHKINWKMTHIYKIMCDLTNTEQLTALIFV